MRFCYFIIKELAKVILKKDYLAHSALLRGIKLYRQTPESDKKGVLRCIKEVINLFYYWDAFPDTYFRFGMFLKDYGDMEKMKSFIPQGAYYRYSNDSDPRYHILIDDKILFHDLMSEYGLPVPERYFTFRQNRFRRGSEFLSDECVESIIEKITDERIFVKNYTGGAASGVHIFTKFAGGGYIDNDGNRVSVKMIRELYANQDVFFEKQIAQEPILRQFNPDTVNTIRVLTYNNKVISAAVRFGGKGSFVDNTAKGGVAVSLDVESGKLGPYGMREFDLTHYTEHPDSHLKFDGTVVTQWPEVKAVVERSINFLPYYKSIGFDVATTENGPVIIEINTGCGIYLSQMGKEKGLRDDFKS